MCIIVAKNQGVKMPAKEIITNCFNNNPDGAGIMLAFKGKVYGFKGLMTLDAFQTKLKQLNKRFGSLDKLPVVMHFRIGTHGANIAANTHPFPVASNYKALRKLEWTADLGMAHNGIIHTTGSHPDVKKENVSDTMVFIRRVAAPICEKLDIFKNPVFFDTLQIVADSKLCFLNGRGQIKVLGKFETDKGIYYSNNTWNTERKKYSYSYTPYAYDWGEAFDFRKDKKYYDIPKLSDYEEAELAFELADDYGLDVISPDDFIVRCDDFEVDLERLTYALDPSRCELLYWDSDRYDWMPSCYQNIEIEVKDSCFNG